MRLFESLALLLCGVLHFTLGSTLKPFHDMNTEEALKYVYEKLAAMEVSFINKHNDLSTKQQELEERISEEKESLNEVSERLLKEKDERLLMDNHILMEVHDLQRKALESVEKINNVKNGITSVSEAVRNKTDMIEAKINETKDLGHSCLASLRDTEDANLKNMSSDEILKILTSHTSEICSINSRLNRVENRCSDPPYVENGYLINSGFEGRNHEAVITYACRGNKILAGNDTMECQYGKWIGELPQCVDPVCTPPCQNEGLCMNNNTCNCTSSFSGDRCHNAACHPPCKNGGKCLINNSCSCTPLFIGDRCQHAFSKCGLDLRNVGIRGSGIVSGNSRSSTPDWPWMAAVHWKREKYPTQPLRCGGSIIHRHFILATAFCMYLYDGNWYLLDGTDLIVRLGMNDQRDRTHRQEYDVRKIYVHAGFNHTTYDYNVALLELEKPIDYNLFIRPVCLPPKETPEDNRFYKPQSSAYVLEWVDDSDYILKESLYVIQPPDICNDKYEEIYKNNYTDRMFCAIDEKSTSCPSYKGAATMQSHLNKEGTSVWTQVGLHDWRCRAEGNKAYSFITHLQKLMPWVDKNIEDALKR